MRATTWNALVASLSTFEEQLAKRLAPSMAGILTPNQVTSLGLVLGVAGVPVITAGGYWAGLVGAMIFYVGRWLDYLDGAVARYDDAKTVFGHYFDITASAITLSVFFVWLGYSYGGPAFVVGAAVSSLPVLNRALAYAVNVRNKRGPATGSLKRRWYNGSMYGRALYDNFGCPPYWTIVPAALADLVWLWFAIAAVGHIALFGYLLFEAHRFAPKRLV